MIRAVLLLLFGLLLMPLPLLVQLAAQALPSGPFAASTCFDLDCNGNCPINSTGSALMMLAWLCWMLWMWCVAAKLLVQALRIRRQARQHARQQARQQVLQQEIQQEIQRARAGRWAQVGEWVRVRAGEGTP